MVKRVIHRQIVVEAREDGRDASFSLSRLCRYLGVGVAFY